MKSTSEAETVRRALVEYGQGVIPYAQIKTIEEEHTPEGQAIIERTGDALISLYEAIDAHTTEAGRHTVNQAMADVINRRHWPDKKQRPS